ncbi:TonB-dependent siderophore receptor [Sphingobium sp. SCG-1]|uniref:TonB-dependent siderophore receptor n=1 Tax=Sphingobium sp. SCG-1 TaxID=2072936 RepID=UPI0016707C8E|nr:TonB-dependent siderophore receptor [Sphingobium sp. SCG-1]
MEASQKAGGDESIVVTGYRFLSEDTSGTTNLPLPIEEVPQSISLVNNDFVKAADLKTTGEIAQYTPGAIFAGDQNSYGSLVKLRGFNSGYAIDGLPVGDSLMEPDVATLSRFELVKGPSSVVYGASRPGGLVNLVSKKASANTPSYVSALGGSWDRWRVEGQLAGSLNASDTVRAIAVGAHEESDSFIHFIKQKKSVVYGGLDFDVASNISAFVRASYQKLNRTPFEGVLTFADGTLPAGVGRSFFLGNGDGSVTIKTARVNAGLSWQASSALSVDLMANYQRVNREGGNSYVYGLQANGDMQARTERFLGWPTEDVNIGASSVLKLDDVGLSDSFISASVRYQSYRETYRGRYTDGQVNLFDGEDAISRYFGSLDGSAPGALTYRDQKLRYLTASTQANVKIAGTLTVLGGLSYSKPTVETRFVEGGAWRAFNPGGQVSLRGGLTVEPVKGLNIYGSYSESFQPQDRTDINDSVLPPLTGKQYELGAKYVSPDRRLLLTAAVFDLRQSNQQVFDQRGADGFDRFRALGEVRHRGLELEATGQIIDQWQIKAGLALLDPKIKKDADPTLIGQTRLYLPKKTASLYTSYDLTDGITLGGGFRHVGSERTSYNGATRPLASYTLADGSVSYKFDDWLLQLNVKNIFDETYYTVGYETLFYGIRPGEPRSFSISLRKDF